MVDYHDIYSSQGKAYDLLVSREDYKGKIASVLRSIRPSDGLSVIDLGAGTGRISRIIAPFPRWIISLDISLHMLRTARANSGGFLANNWSLVQADNRKLPFCDRSLDVAIAGWTFGHFTGWYPDRWQDEIDQCVGEMKRLLRSSGTIIILETLGTGRESPKPPTDALARYYAHLQDDLGFKTDWMRSDYHFKSVDEAVYLTRFFFGEELARRVASEKIMILPECTGIWWLHL